MKKFWKKEEKRELTTLEMFKLVYFAKQTIDSIVKMGTQFPYELSTLLESYAMSEKIPYYSGDTYGKVLELKRIVENI